MRVRYLNKNDYIYTLEFNENQLAKGNNSNFLIIHRSFF